MGVTTTSSMYTVDVPVIPTEQSCQRCAHRRAKRQGGTLGRRRAGITTTVMNSGNNNHGDEQRE